MITEKFQIIKNSIYQYVGEIISKAIFFIFNSITARYLGVENYGLFTFALGFAVLISSFIDFGTNNFLLKKVSDNNESLRFYLRKLIILEVVLSSVFFVALIVTMPILDYAAGTKQAIFILYFSVVCESITGLYRSGLKAIKSFKKDTVINVINSAVRALLGLSGLLIFKSVIYLSIGILLSTAVTLVLSEILLRKDLRLIPKAQNINCSNIGLLLVCLSYAVPSILKGVYYRVDGVIIERSLSLADLGFYNSASRLLLAQYFFPITIIMVVFPYLSKMFYDKDFEKSNLLVKDVFITLAIAFNFMQLVEAIYAKQIINIIYGVDYSYSIGIYKIIILSFVFTALTYFISCIFIANDKVTKTNIYYSISLVLKVIFTIIASSSFGIMGAVYAFLISEIIQFVIFAVGNIRNNISFDQKYFFLPTSLIIFDLALIGINTNEITKCMLAAIFTIILLKVFKIRGLLYEH